MSDSKLVDWDAFKWETTTDAEIARATGLSRARVGQIRHHPKHPRPKCLRWHQRIGTAKDKIEAMNPEKTRRMTKDQVASIAGCEPEYAEQCLQKFGKPYTKPPDLRRKTKYDWEAVTLEQWMNLTDREVGVLLGVPNPGVVAQWRRRNGIIKKPSRVRIPELHEFTPSY